MAEEQMKRILAKSTGETLAAHTEACLNAARALLRALPLPDREVSMLERPLLLGVAVHDVGKAASGFQRVLTRDVPDWQGRRHEILSAAFASGISDLDPAMIFAVLTTHRSIPSDGVSGTFGSLPREQIPFPGSESPVWRRMEAEWEENLDAFQDEWQEICHALGRSIPINGLQPLSLDQAWIRRGIGRRTQARTFSYEERSRASLLRGLLVAADHLGSAHTIPPPVPDLKRYPVLCHTPRSFQNVIGGTEGSAILRAPTGSGKTEAALLWAQRNQPSNGRLFYVLPFTASINAMHGRLSHRFGKDNVGVLHHRAIAYVYSCLGEDATQFSPHKRQKIACSLTELAREVYFPIKVCTPHQILKYTLRGRGWENMLIEFPRACFIFDEIHAYDPRIVGLTLSSARLLTEWGARILFMSATLPTFLHRLIVDSMGDLPFIEPDPSFLDDREILERKRHKVSLWDGTVIGSLRKVAVAARQVRSTLIVCNHVTTAQEVYRLLRPLLPDEKIMLLHGRFNHSDRNRIERAVTSGTLPRVLIATQVVEVSLNVDFDQAFLEPAPIDALIQRMGRVNREGRRDPAEIVIFTRQVHPFNLYCTCAGGDHAPGCRITRTLQVLSNLDNPIGELDLVGAADEVYSSGYCNGERTVFEEGLNHPDLTSFRSSLVAGTHREWVGDVIEQLDGMIEVLPAGLRKAYEEKLEQGLWIEAANMLVPVRVRSLRSLGITQEGDLWITRCRYTPNTGLITSR